MKHVKLTSIALFFLILIPAGFAHADFFGSYADLYTVGSSGSTTPQTTFSINQLPTLFIQYYAVAPSTPITQTDLFVLQSPTGTTYTPWTVATTNQTWIWYPASVWNSIKETGTWTLTAFSFNNGQPLTGGPISFKITAAPEPVSTVLFMMGAFIMGISLLRRNKSGLAV